MPKSVPLRHMAVTMVEPSMSRAGSVIALPIAMRDVEEELVVAADEVEAARRAPSLSVAVRASAGASRRSSRREQATLRWCISSPMVRPRAISGFSGMPPMSRSARPSAGPSAVAQPGEAGEHLGVVAAEPHHLAEAFVDGAVGAIAEGAVLDHHQRLAHAWSCRSSGRRRRSDGWGGTRRRRAAALRSASARSLRPALEHGDAHDAPRIGPHMRPSRSAARRAGSSGRSSAPGSPRRPARTSTRTGSPDRMRRTASALAVSISSMAEYFCKSCGQPRWLCPHRRHPGEGRDPDDRRLRLHCQTLAGGWFSIELIRGHRSC